MRSSFLGTGTQLAFPFLGTERECDTPSVKHKQKKQGGFLRPLMNTYLQEFMWRQKFGDKPFTNLVLQIASVYPV